MRLFFNSQSAAPATSEKRSMGMGPFGIADLTSRYGHLTADTHMSIMENSMQSVAIRSAVDLISSLGSELPMQCYVGTGPSKRPIPTPSYLLDPAGDGRGIEDFRYQVLESWLLRGNTFGMTLASNGAGIPTQRILYHPDEINGYVAPDGDVNWFIRGMPLDPEFFFHRRVNPIPGRIEGLSPIQFHAHNIGLSLISTRFGVEWFKAGAHPSGILTYTEDLDQNQAREAKDRFMAAMRDNAEPIVYGKGWDYKAIQVPPEESQFLQTQGFSEAQCCRIFGPGVAETLGFRDEGKSDTYANLSDRTAHLMIFALNKWLKRLERFLSEMLPDGQYVMFDRDSLLDTTTMDRYNTYELALRNRFMTVNEVRARDGLLPVAWGDEPNIAAIHANTNFTKTETLVPPLDPTIKPDFPPERK